MSKRVQPTAVPRAIARTGADIARAAKVAKAAIGARLPSPKRPAPEPEPKPTAAPKSTGGFAGLIGVPDAPVDPNALDPDQRPWIETTWFPMSSFTPQSPAAPVPPSTPEIPPKEE